MQKHQLSVRSLIAASLIATSSLLPLAPALTETSDLKEVNNIPITGSGDPQLQPILQSVTEFMRHRCVGAAVVGVSVKGKPVGVWGLGRMNGRPTNNWNTACGNDMNASLAPVVPPNTPMRIGSISKPVTFAMVRWALKKVAKDKVGLELTDEQIEGLKLFDPQHYPPLIPGTNKSYPVAIIPKDVYEVFSGKIKYSVAIKDGFKYGGDVECAITNRSFFQVSEILAFSCQLRSIPRKSSTTSVYGNRRSTSSNPKTRGASVSASKYSSK